MLKKNTLIKMGEIKGEWCVSIYLPIGSHDSQENRTRLKNLMFDAEKNLIDLNMTPLNVAKMLIPVELLLDNPEFWKVRSKGFAVFLTPDSFTWFSLVYQVEEQLVVNNRFYLKPLLKNASQSSFYQKRITFFEASEAKISEIISRGIPLDNFCPA